MTEDHPIDVDLLRGEGPAQPRLDAQDVEEVRRRRQESNLHRLTVAGRRQGRAEQLHAGDGFDRASGALQFVRVGAREPVARRSGCGGLISPHPIELLGGAIRERFDQNLVDGRVHHGERAEADRERGHGGADEQRLARQAAARQLDVPTPVAGAAPESGGPQVLGRPVYNRVEERARRDLHDTAEPASASCLDRALVVGGHDRVAHRVAEVGRVEPQQQAKPAHR